LVRKSLITRTRDAVDRREVNLSVTDDGRRLVKGVVERRRREVQAMLRSIPADARVQLATSLDLLARAAGETPELHWAPGWHANDVVPAAGRRVTTPSAS